MFTHLHVHTDYSIGDGVMKIADLCRKVHSCGMNSVALTDHGTLYGTVPFYNEARKWGLKPIIGCEAYVCPDCAVQDQKQKLHHLVLLAQNQIGYHNLLRLMSRANLEHFYRKPRIDKRLLAEHADGLIALSACIQGEIPRKIIAGDMDAARNAALEYLEIFPDRFYLELQANGLHDQEKANLGLMELAHELCIPMVATADCHYLNKSDHDLYRTLAYAAKKGGEETGDAAPQETRELYLKSPARMADDFSFCVEAYWNAAEIANRCEEIRIAAEKPIFPVYELPEGISEEAELRRLAEESLEKRIDGKSCEEKDAYRTRLDHELRVICQMGFAGYFLVVQDIVAEARRRGIAVGPGRGSAVGSLAVYALGITGVDPVQNGLLFERFLNPERVSLPDVDLDFEKERRNEILEYLKGKYGSDRVARIANITFRKAKSAIRDAGRILETERDVVERVCSFVPAKPDATIADAMENGELKGLCESDGRIKALLELSLSLENLARQPGVHASGVVISGASITDWAPIYASDRKSGEMATQFDGNGVEQAGYVKFDVLGLATCSIIENACHYIVEAGKHAPDLENLPMDDPAVLRLFSRGETEGVFQMEGGAKTILRELKPECFADIVAVNALNRPGPLNSGMVESFVKRRHGQEPVSYFGLDDALEPILKETYGIFLYQEQVMQAAVVLAGYSPGQADLLRRAMGKKKKDEMARERERFLSGAADRGIAKEKADEIFDIMERFAAYGFNKSHSAAYALTAWRCAYLKAHYPAEFMAAVLNAADNLEETAAFAAESRRMGIAVEAPSVNLGRAEFTPQDQSILYGLSAIKGIGAKPAREIAGKRPEGGYTGLYDLCLRVNKGIARENVLESLIRCGACDCFGQSRAAMLANLDRALEAAKGRKGDPVFADSSEAPESDLARWEEELLGYSSRAIFADFDYEGLKCARLSDFPGLGGKEAECPVRIVKARAHKTRAGEPMAFLTVRDDDCEAEITVFEKALPRNQDGTVNRRLFREGERILVRCKESKWTGGNAREGEIRLQALSMRPLAA